MRGQMARYLALTASEITDALSSNLAYERVHRKKKRIFSQRVGTNPLIIPLSDVVIGLHKTFSFALKVSTSFFCGCVTESAQALSAHDTVQA